MRIKILFFLLFLSNFLFCQEKLDIVKPINGIENYNVQEIVTKIEKLTTVYGTFKETIEISGTLITPKTDFDKILVILSGTGRTSQYSHSYLTEYLLENNIGVFRFDRRGVGKSTGKQSYFYQVYINDFINIYKELKKTTSLQKKQIGFLGHSLGGIISILAIEKGFKPDFLIQWAAPIGKPRDVIKYQIKNGIINYNNQILGSSIEERIKILDFINNIIDKNPNKNAWKLGKIAKKESKKINIKKKVYTNYLSTNNVEFARIDNSKTYKEIDFKTLVIIGKEDIMVDPNHSKIELEKIKNPSITFKELKGLNHFMTKKETNQKTNEIYNIDLSFKKYVVKWITELKN